jgi:hypothetical protein
MQIQNGAQVCNCTAQDIQILGDRIYSLRVRGSQKPFEFTCQTDEKPNRA